MRITALHIENFGKLSDVDLQFDKGLNYFCEDNGWGKSTLAAFIKVMFYGFDNDRKQDDIVNERRRYKPWQGGAYGGSLSFTVGDRHYKATRIFGNKEADDVFELRDEETQLICDDYDAFLGETILNIDSESFRRTVFIAESDCQCTMSDSISAKMGNLVDNTDDINNFESVIKKLSDMINAIGPKRRGKLKVLKDDIAELLVKIKAGENIDETADEIMAKKALERARYDELKQKQEEITAKQKEYASRKDKQALRQGYVALLDAFNQKNEEYESSKAKLEGRELDVRDLEEYINRASELLKKKSMVSSQGNEKALKMEKLDGAFANGLPDNGTINDYIGKWGEYKEISRGLSRREAKLDTFETMHIRDVEDARKNNAGKGMLIIVLAVLIMAAGIGLYFVNMILGIGIIGVGVVVMLLGLLKKAKSKTIDVLYPDEYEELKRALNDDYEYMQELRDDTKDFLDNYRISFNEETAVADLMNLRDDAANYETLKASYAKDSRLRREIEVLEDKLNGYLMQSGFADVSAEKAIEVLSDYKSRTLLFLQIKKQWKELKLEKESFEDEHPDYESLLGMDKLDAEVSLEENENELKVISESLEELHRLMLDYDRQLDALHMRQEEISEYERTYEELIEQQESATKEYDILSKTKDYLTKAKQSFVNRYTKPVKDSFDKYYGLLAKMDADRYNLDADMKLYVNEHGLQRGIAHLSTGYQNLVGICMRMALIDAMYTDNRPFVIFDDPFVNLDDNKSANAKAFLDVLANEHQIIYMTCHSRL